MRKTPSGKWFTTTIYLSEDMVNEIETRRDTLESRHPGIRVTLSDVMRNAISRGLNEDDED